MISCPFISTDLHLYLKTQTKQLTIIFNRCTNTLVFIIIFKYLQVRKEEQYIKLTKKKKPKIQRKRIIRKNSTEIVSDTSF